MDQALAPTFFGLPRQSVDRAAALTLAVVIALVLYAGLASNVSAGSCTGTVLTQADVVLPEAVKV